MASKKRKKYSCDFETTTKLDDCRVWGYGLMEIGNFDNFIWGNNIDDFMEWVSKANSDLYFHNLKFDGSFIVNWLLKNGFEYGEDGQEGTFNVIISKQGQWYMIDINYGYKSNKKVHTVIYDSLKKLPFSVDRIAKSFNLPILKGDIDYNKDRSIGYEITPEELSYIKNDVEIVARALDIQFSKGLTNMTNGSDSLNGYKDTITRDKFKKLFPTISNDMDNQIRKAYRGGFTWLNDKYQGKDLGEGIVFDVNSLYPSVMYNKDLPYGLPQFYYGKYTPDDDYPLYIQHIRFEFDIKKDHIPTIQIKKSFRFNDAEYLKSSDNEQVDLWLTNVDLELIKEHYKIYNEEYLEGWKFKSKQSMFNKFIEYWNGIKTTERGAIRQLAKLQLNSLYGKFASNPDVTGMIPYIKDNGANGFVVGEDEVKDPVYTAMGAFITSYSRELTIRTAQKCYDRIIYCDTDSIHLIGKDIPDIIKDIVDDNKMGYWAFESRHSRARYLRQKTYIQEIEGELIVKCAGMPSTVKEKVTWDNFQIGFTSNGKLLPKQVNGGVVLVDTDFTLK